LVSLYIEAMDILERITTDMKEAMRSGDTLRRDTLRMLRGQILEPGAPDALTVLKRAVKTRRESAEQYAAAGRDDLATQENAEIVVLEAYLPKTMSETDAREAIAAIAAAEGLTSKRDMGKLMQAIMAEHQGAIDGKLASKLASEILGGS
jgi:uncharacterized protein